MRGIPMETKQWWQSTTIRGAIIAVLGALFGILSIIGVVEVSTAEIDLLVTSALTAIGSIISIIGRFKAKTTIGGGN